MHESVVRCRQDGHRGLTYAFDRSRLGSDNLSHLDVLFCHLLCDVRGNADAQSSIDSRPPFLFLVARVGEGKHEPQEKEVCCLF